MKKAQNIENDNRFLYAFYSLKMCDLYSFS